MKHPHDRLVGTTLSDRYRIETLLADEMLGRVYRGRDLSKGKLAQIKVLYPHLAADPEKFRRFEREFKTTRMVRHPNTLDLTDWGQDGGIYYLVFEFVRAHTLQEELDAGPLTPIRAARIAAQVAVALAAAHQEGVVHRGLSPHNILVLDNVASGVFIKVRDFGLSRLEDDVDGDITAVGTRLGSVAYMSPEYIDDGTVHARGDVYALGVMLYQMVTGQLPFEGSAAAVLNAHVTHLLPAVTGVRRSLPSWWDGLVAQLTVKDPARRPGAYEAVEMIRAVAGEEALNRPLLLPLDDEGNFVLPPTVPKTVAVGATVAAAGATALLGLAALAAVAAGLLCWTSPEAEVSVAPEPEQRAVTEVAPLPVAVAPVEAAAAEPDAPTPAPAVQPTPPPAHDVGIVQVRANRRALVFVDGQAAGYTPLDKALLPGEHTVSASLPGRMDQQQTETVGLSRGETAQVSFQF